MALLRDGTNGTPEAAPLRCAEVRRGERAMLSSRGCYQSLRGRLGSKALTDADLFDYCYGFELMWV